MSAGNRVSWLSFVLDGRKYHHPDLSGLARWLCCRSARMGCRKMRSPSSPCCEDVQLWEHSIYPVNEVLYDPVNEERTASYWVRICTVRYSNEATRVLSLR